MPYLNLQHPMAIAMWDFSWLERRWPGAGYENWDVALDELVERGYDAVRIDAFPHLVAATTERDAFTLVPVWDQHDWGSPLPVQVAPGAALVEFVGACAARGVKVALSSWFREDADNLRMEVTSGAALGQIWIDTLVLLDRAGLIDALVYVDLCNEWADPTWAPYLYDWTGTRPDRALRSSARVQEWTNTALSVVRDSFPQLPLCFSASDELALWRDQDVSQFDLLEPHIWMAHDVQRGFYAELGYDMHGSLWDRRQYETLARRAPQLYRDREKEWKDALDADIAGAAQWSQASGLPLVTTECWAIVNWKDGAALDWEWVKDLCAHGVRTALATGRWMGVATSNFCGPQYRGMWRDVTWHRELTDEIKNASIATSNGPSVLTSTNR